METPFPMPNPNDPAHPLQILKSEAVLVPAQFLQWFIDAQKDWQKEAIARREREVREAEQLVIEAKQRAIEAQERKAQTEALERCTHEIKGLREDLGNLDKAVQASKSEFQAFKSAEEKEAEMEVERAKVRAETRQEIMQELGIDIEARVASPKSKAWWVQLSHNYVLIICVTILSIMALATVGGPGILQAIQAWKAK
jgi:hypothetical protein